jgi:ABC-type phosphate transport system substrate-binding protein
MKNIMKKIVWLFAFICFSVFSLNAQNTVKIVVNSSNSVSSVSKSELLNIFLKKVSVFGNGVAAKPVDQSGSSPARATFSRLYLGKPVYAVKNYWDQQKLSGAGIPPDEKSSDDEVMSYVKSNAGGIGYVSSDADASGVKVIEVK